MPMTLAELLALLPDNSTGAIGADDMRTVTTELYNQPAAGAGGTAGGDLTGTYPNPDIAANTISNTELWDVATNTIKGRVAAGTGDPQDLTAAQVAGLLTHGALLAVKVWSSTQYVWPGDGSAPDANAYTNILFVDPTGTHDPKTSTGGRNNANDLWETGATGTGGGGGGGATDLLVRTYHNPGTTSSTASTTTSFVDVDATNLAATFTVPASGAVVVTLSANASIPGNTELSWGLRSGSSDVAGSACKVVFGGAVSNQVTCRPFYRVLITGLTPAASLTYKWSEARSFGAGTPAQTLWGGTEGPAIMEVRSG